MENDRLEELLVDLVEQNRGLAYALADLTGEVREIRAELDWTNELSLAKQIVNQSDGLQSELDWSNESSFANQVLAQGRELAAEFDWNSDLAFGKQILDRLDRVIDLLEQRG